MIIIAAGRSGTKMLRDILIRLQGFGTWPCDEINYIWRCGNREHPTDELQEVHARPEVIRYIRNEFKRLGDRQRLETIVEKTCANSLRVGFVNAVFPHARFIFLIRDGRDVTASAASRWKGGSSLAYLLRKARFIPRQDLAFYLSRYACNYWHRFRNQERRLATWGPRFAGLDDLAARLDLEEVCARQWEACVLQAAAGLARIPDQDVYRLRYEDFVAHPAALLEELGRFFGLRISAEDCASWTRSVSRDRLGSWKLLLKSPEKISQLLLPTLRQFGYEA